MKQENITGYENEFKFMYALNQKKIKEINNLLLRNFIDELFDKPNKNSLVKCHIDASKRKYDIVIIINHITKRISIKKGYKNSVHVERISDFIHFLIKNNVNRNTIIEYLKYHYADGTTNGSGENRISAEDYKKNNQGKIDFINKEINNKQTMEKAIDRFIIKGNCSDIPIDALIYGTVNDFIWIKSEEIKQIMFSKLYTHSTAVHFGPLTVQPMDRCLNRNPKYESKRYCVQIKWYNIFDDIIEFKNNQVMACEDIPDIFFLSE